MVDQRNDMGGTAIRPATFADQVYGRILDGILSGDFPTGERLPSESRLGELFGVSRPVVREALARLQRDGMVDIRKGSGSHVRASPPADLSRHTGLDQVARYQRFQEFRLVVEGASAALAAERRSETEMARIQAAQDAFVADIRAGRFLWRSDKALHLAIAEAAGNEFFARSLEGPELELGDFMHVSLSLTSSRSPERGEIVIREHASIVDAIRAHDATGARVTMEHHLLQSRKRMLDRSLAP
jgi:GntR family transcriptional repressor for pyruvate dehydrogenase complex